MRFPSPLAVCLVACVATGCPTSEDLPADVTCDDPALVGDANNYTFDGALDVQVTEVQAYSDEAPVDYLVDWSGLTADLQGHALDPAVDIDSASIVALPHLTPEEAATALSTNSLTQADIGAYSTAVVTGRTSVQLSELALFGNDIDIESYLTEGSATWMLLLSTGTTTGVGTRQLHFLIPSAASSNTSVAVTDDSTVLDYTVDLDSLTPVYAPAGTFTVDWSALTVDGRGAPLEQSDIDTAKLAWFADASFASLAGDFLDVETNADKLWSAPIAAGSTLDLATLQGDEAFTGLGDGTWALALQCSSCPNPAPLLFTELRPCP